MRIYGDRLGYGEIKLSPATELTLLNYDWPGNIRELENAIHRAILVCQVTVYAQRTFSYPALELWNMTIRFNDIFGKRVAAPL